MPIRTAIMIRGIGLMLNHPIAITDYWGPIAERVLNDSGTANTPPAPLSPAANGGGR
jgi:hypothetical protein